MTSSKRAGKHKLQKSTKTAPSKPSKSGGRATCFVRMRIDIVYQMKEPVDSLPLHLDNAGPAAVIDPSRFATNGVLKVLEECGVVAILPNARTTIELDFRKHA